MPTMPGVEGAVGKYTDTLLPVNFLPEGLSSVSEDQGGVGSVLQGSDAHQEVRICRLPPLS
jgi:hypothetical protein